MIIKAGRGLRLLDREACFGGPERWRRAQAYEMDFRKRDDWVLPMVVDGAASGSNLLIAAKHAQ